MVRTRFAPSPTGYLHVGGLRTALYSYLIAKQNNGKFLLRVEDTDVKRTVDGTIENLLKSLNWAGIMPDEGVLLIKKGEVEQIGDKGPYIQSQRLDLYRKHAEQLIDQGHAYYCFCSAERLEKLRQEQQKRGLPTGYDGHCRSIPPEEAMKRVQPGEARVIRMKMPTDGETVFNDLIRGKVKFQNKLLDDQVIIKSDGYPTYHLAVVVDDHYMEITHIIRGEEWLSSTPKHVQLYKYFGWEAPSLAHLPLLLNPDRTKLSKRQGDVAVEDYKNKGYLPEALINFVVLLGWNPGSEKELFTLEELIKEFSLEKVNKSGAVFNIEKLNWMNKQYIKNFSNDELIARAEPFFAERGMGKVERGLLIKAVSLERERITVLSELPEALAFVFNLPDYAPELLVWKKNNADELKKVLPELKDSLYNFSVQDWNKQVLEQKIGEWIKQKMYSTGSVLWPMRVALSGQDKSPGPFEIAEVLGKNETLDRIELAEKKARGL